MSKLPPSLYTALFAGLLVNSAWAQDGGAVRQPIATNLRYPAGTEITFQWIYSCPTGGKSCSFNCQGPGGGVDRATALEIYIGSTPIGNNRTVPALIYVYSTQIFASNSGFIMSPGELSKLSCQITGMTLDYSGPLK